MTATIDLFRASVDPADVERLLRIRDEAVTELKARCPGLRRAELMRLDETTWLDLLVWQSPEAAAEAARHFGAIPALGEMHALIGDPLSHERGTLEHSA